MKSLTEPRLLGECLRHQNPALRQGLYQAVRIRRLQDNAAQELKPPREIEPSARP